MLVGIIYIRTKTREMVELGGLGTVMPRLMGFGLIIALAAVGLPLLIGFVGEFLVFAGAFNSSLDEITPIKIYSIIAISILIMSAAYMLRLLHKTFFANLFEKWHSVNDITNHEFVVLFALILVIGFFGIFPMSMLDVVQPILTNILQYLQV